MICLRQEDDDEANGERDDRDAFQQEQRQLECGSDIFSRLGLTCNRLGGSRSQTTDAETGPDRCKTGTDASASFVLAMITGNAMY